MKIISLSVLLFFSASSFTNPATETKMINQSDLKETIQVYATPDNEGSVTVFSDNKKTLSFYLFDVEGKLIYQTKIAQNEKQTIEGLEKGTYLYHAFENDKNLKGGKIILQ